MMKHLTKEYLAQHVRANLNSSTLSCCTPSLSNLVLPLLSSPLVSYTRLLFPVPPRPTVAHHNTHRAPPDRHPAHCRHHLLSPPFYRLLLSSSPAQAPSPHPASAQLSAVYSASPPPPPSPTSHLSTHHLRRPVPGRPTHHRPSHSFQPPHVTPT